MAASCSGAATRRASAEAAAGLLITGVEACATSTAGVPGAKGATAAASFSGASGAAGATAAASCSGAMRTASGVKKRGNEDRGDDGEPSGGSDEKKRMQPKMQPKRIAAHERSPLAEPAPRTRHPNVSDRSERLST